MKKNIIIIVGGDQRQAIISEIIALAIAKEHNVVIAVEPENNNINHIYTPLPKLDLKDLILPAKAEATQIPKNRDKQHFRNLSRRHNY